MNGVDGSVLGFNMGQDGERTEATSLQSNDITTPSPWK